MAPDLARRARAKLQKMILQHAPTWGPIVEEYEQSLRQQQAALDQLQQAYAIATQECAQWQQHAREREQSLRQQQAALDELQQVYAVAAQECAQWQQLAQEREQTLHQQHAALDACHQAYAVATQEQGRWQRLAQERGARIAILEDTLWVRLGLRLGIIRPPGSVSRDENQAKNLSEF